MIKKILGFCLHFLVGTVICLFVVNYFVNSFFGHAELPELLKIILLPFYIFPFFVGIKLGINSWRE